LPIKKDFAFIHFFIRESSTHLKAIFNACLSARSRVFKINPRVDPLDIVAYCSDQAHSTAARAAGMSLMKISERFLKCSNLIFHGHF